MVPSVAINSNGLLSYLPRSDGMKQACPLFADSTRCKNHNRQYDLYVLRYEHVTHAAIVSRRRHNIYQKGRKEYLFYSTNLFLSFCFQLSRSYLDTCSEFTRIPDLRPFASWSFASELQWSLLLFLLVCTTTLELYPRPLRNFLLQICLPNITPLQLLFLEALLLMVNYSTSQWNCIHDH